MGKEFEITDSLIADYQAAWDHADRMPGREPGDRRRAGLAAVAPIIIESVLRKLADGIGSETAGVVGDFAYEKYGIDL